VATGRALHRFASRSSAAGAALWRWADPPWRAGSTKRRNDAANDVQCAQLG
jgi:hypothetical protein